MDKLVIITCEAVDEVKTYLATVSERLKDIEIKVYKDVEERMKFRGNLLAYDKAILICIETYELNKDTELSRTYFTNHKWSEDLLLKLEGM